MAPKASLGAPLGDLDPLRGSPAASQKPPDLHFRRFSSIFPLNVLLFCQSALVREDLACSSYQRSQFLETCLTSIGSAFVWKKSTTAILFRKQLAIAAQQTNKRIELYLVEKILCPAAPPTCLLLATLGAILAPERHLIGKILCLTAPPTCLLLATSPSFHFH